MDKNQKGFSAVEGLLILIIVGLLIFVGWYVWNSNNKTKQSSKNANKSSSVSSQQSTKKSTIQTPTGWVAYQNQNLGIDFAYPENWTFEDKSKAPISTKSYYIGDLTSEDKNTTVAITLIRKKDGRNTYSTVEEWKSANSDIKYSNLTEVKSKYIAFSYVLNVSGATSLVYQILEPNNNIEMLVLPTGASHEAIIEQIVSTLRFE